MPIVMGMVSGVFLRFALDLVYAIRDQFWIAGPMVLVFFAVSAVPLLAPRVPPLIAAMIMGAVMVVALGEFHPAAGGTLMLARPNLHAPVFSWQALIELVVRDLLDWNFGASLGVFLLTVVGTLFVLFSTLLGLERLTGDSRA